MRCRKYLYGRPVLWCLAFIVQLAPSHTQGQPLVKNLLYVVIDDLTANLKTFAGDYDVSTPNIDRLRDESLHLTRAYSQEAVCCPSRNSFLSGLRPDTSRAFTFLQSFRDTFPNITSLPQMFKENNFTTCGSGKVFHDGQPADDDSPYSWSFDRCGDYLNPDYDVCPGSALWCSFNTTQEEDDTVYVDARIANAAIGHFKLVQEYDEPWAVFVGFRKPHIPWFIPQKFVDMQPAAEDIPLPKNPYFPKDTPVVAWLNATTAEFLEYKDIEHTNPYVPLPDNLTRLIKQYYFGGVSFVDYQLGRVLDALESEGLMDDTVIILHSDHGYQLGEHNSWSKSTNWEMSTRVPLLVRVPGSPTRDNTSLDTPVNLLDLYRTLGDLFGLTVDPVVEGLSFADLLTKGDGEGGDPGNTTEERMAASWFPRCISADETVAAGLGPVPEYIWTDCAPFKVRGIDKMGMSVRGDKWRYTEWRDWIADDLDVDWTDEGLYGVELYHHPEDGTAQSSDDENTNLAFDDSLPLGFKENLASQLRTIFKGPSLADGLPAEGDQPDADTEEVTGSSGSGSVSQNGLSRSWVIVLCVGVAVGFSVTVIGVILLWPRMSRGWRTQAADSQGPQLTNSLLRNPDASGYSRP